MKDEYYITIIRAIKSKFIGPFKSRKEAGNFNREYCKGQAHIYHYKPHRLRPFTGEVVSPKDYLKEEE